MTLIITLFLLLTSKGEFQNLDIPTFKEKIIDNQVVLIDVRTAEEFEAGHIPGAINIDWYGSDFLQKAEQVCTKDKPVALYCRSGKRSLAAAVKMTRSGYQVLNLKGGFNAWQEAGEPVTRYEVETFHTNSGKTVGITLIKHGSLAISYDGLSIQVDPVSGLGKPTDYAAEFPKADVILVTHEHGDHLDQTALEALTKESTRLILNGTSAKKIGRGEVIGNGETWTLPKGIILEAVPAYNTTPGREKFHPKGNGNGYVLTLDGLRIYIAGDTEGIPEMENLKDIDIAFLPVNQPYTMTVGQCAAATRMIRPKVLIPYHFSDTDLTGLQELLPGQEILFRNMQ